MNLTTLQYFVEVADERNFSKAAIKNHVSQTAISQQVAHLEKELNVQLFVRTQPIQLTQAGKRVYRRAKIILDQYVMMKGDIEEVKLQKYVYRIAYAPEFILPLETIIFPSFIKLIDTEFSLSETNLTMMQDMLERKMIDFALCYDSEITDHSNLNFLSVKEGNFDLLSSTKYNLEKLNENDLSQMTLIYVKDKRQSHTLESILQRMAKEGIVFKDLKYVGNFESALMLASLDKGVTLIPDFMSISSNLNLKRINLSTINLSYDLGLAYRKGNQRVQELIPNLKKLVRSNCL